MPDFSFVFMHGHYTINRRKSQNYVENPEANGTDIQPQGGENNAGKLPDRIIGKMECNLEVVYNV